MQTARSRTRLGKFAQVLANSYPSSLTAIRQLDKFNKVDEDGFLGFEYLRQRLLREAGNLAN